jgi:S1-C subfamily serine protease
VHREVVFGAGRLGLEVALDSTHYSHTYGHTVVLQIATEGQASVLGVKKGDVIAAVNGRVVGRGARAELGAAIEAHEETKRAMCDGARPLRVLLRRRG